MERDSSLLEEMLAEEVRLASMRRRGMLVQIAMLFAAVALAFVVLLTGSGSESKFTKKDILSSSILTAIENGADLRVVRNIYANRTLEGRGIRKLFGTMDGYYGEAVPLSKVLEDLRTSLYQKENAPSDTLVSMIDQLFRDHVETNPFDALEVSQKDYFENIRIKSGESYTAIQPDVDKVVMEMVTKNALVEKYLSRSETSFFISIVAVVLSIGFGGIQMYQSKSSRISKEIREELRSVLEVLA